MKAANLETGYVIRYDDSAWKVTSRAVSVARGDGCVVMATFHDPQLEMFVMGSNALVFDRFDDDVWVYHFAHSPYPHEWAYPTDHETAGL
jgi:hypothetical protein